MEKAKEAYRKERLILKQREEKNLAEQANTELTGFVRVNSIYFTFGLKLNSTLLFIDTKLNSY